MQADRSMGSWSCHMPRYWRSLGTIFCASIFLLAVPPNLRPQTLAVVEGMVTDQQDLRVAGAIVSISNPAFGTDRSTTSGLDGAYRIPGLAAGTYTISSSKSGFTVETYRNLELTVNSKFTLNIKLKVGGR